MKIKNVSEEIVYLVETDESDLNQYIRYGPDSWMVTMGCSDEVVNDCEKLEAAFEEYIKWK